MKKNRTFNFIKEDFPMKINQKVVRTANPRMISPFFLYLLSDLRLAYHTISWVME
jgi:hypothetical protein